MKKCVFIQRCLRMRTVNSARHDSMRMCVSTITRGIKPRCASYRINYTQYSTSYNVLEVPEISYENAPNNYTLHLYVRNNTQSTGQQSMQRHVTGQLTASRLQQ